MSKIMTKIVNAETGEEIEREMNVDELAQYEADQAETLARQNAEATKAAEKAALLEKLGITQEEALLLLS